MKNLMLASLCSVILFSCAQKRTYKVRTLPGLPSDFLQGKTILPRLESVPREKASEVIVAWTNRESPWSSHYATRVESTVDFTNWQEVGLFPYALAGSVRLTNDLQMQFFRVSNTIVK